MKNKLFLILTVILLMLCSWGMLNSNSWHIRIAKKDLLTSQKNQMGDIAIINTKKTKSTDTLFVSRYLCGLSADGSITTLTIKNQQDEIIAEIINKDNQRIFTAKMPLLDILNANKYSKEQMLSIFFSIDSKKEQLTQTILLGKLKFK